MTRLALPLLAAVFAACLLAPASASSHELLVLPVGSGELDAGLGDPARLIHGTLDQPEDALVVTVRATGTPLELLLLTPERRPERTLSDDELPSMTVTGPGVELDEAAASDLGTVIDEGTAVEYRVLVTTTAAARAGAALTITIRRGDEPARVALRVGPPTSFEAANVDQTPRALVNLRAWVETPAPSAAFDREPPKTTARPIVALYGAGIALLGILLGVWWVWSGRRRSRERGAERAAEERRS